MHKDGFRISVAIRPSRLISTKALLCGCTLLLMKNIVLHLSEQAVLIGKYSQSENAQLNFVTFL
jgi:hypothetical protein